MTNKLWDTFDRLDSEDKWTLGRLYDERTGARCLLGAYANVCDEDIMTHDISEVVKNDPEIEVLFDVVREHYPNYDFGFDKEIGETFVIHNKADGLANFNDQHMYADVVTMTEKAAIKFDEIL